MAAVTPYTDKQIKFIMDKKVEGYSFPEIAEMFEETFGEAKSASNMSDMFQRRKHEYDLPEIEKHPERARKEKQAEIMDKFLGFIRDNKYAPTESDMVDLGVPANTIRYHFGGLDELEMKARETYPQAFSKVIDEHSFTDEEFRNLKEDISKYKKFVVTTAVTGCEVHQPALDAIKNYCKRNKAKLLVLPCSDPASNRKKKWSLDPRVMKSSVVFRDLKLNSKVFLSAIKLSAKHINPLTGLSRIGQRSGSFIYASPKQFLEYVANSSVKKVPRALMTTGAITKPQYNTAKYMSERTAYIADHDHVMGAVIVEIEDQKIFHFRQIQMEPKTGAFYDIDTKYFADGKISRYNGKDHRADLVQLGDYHVGDTDPMPKQVGKEICDAVGPKFLTVEDFFNGGSINHHEFGRPITQSMKVAKKYNVLDDELLACKKELDEILGWRSFDQIVVKYGNHEDFLYRYLNSRAIIEDPVNYARAINLTNAILNENQKNPFEYAMRKSFGLGDRTDVKFLENEDDSFVVNGIENGVHGHVGANGSRQPGLEGIEKAYGAANVGHSHTAGILRGVFRVGTTSFLKVSYNRGASSWTHTHLIQHPNGSRQLINCISGKWRLK